MTTSPTPPFGAFAQDVLEGLDRPDRRLSSKWFYDERGSQLFDEITRLPEYYLTEAEASIYHHRTGDLLPYLQDGAFDLIELGAGNGSKTQILLEHFFRAGLRFAYRPIDLSNSALQELGELIRLRWPSLDFAPLHAEYFEALDRLGKGEKGQQRRRRRRLLLFPGANIGNFTPPDAVRMLQRLRGFLTPGDLLLTGFDLKKDPATILAAYNDATGITAAFNLNLLRRINRELGGNFVLDCWRHWETYDPVTGAARSYLVPEEPQRVTLGGLGRSYDFEAWEPISVEISQKYSLPEIEGLAEQSGFRFLAHLSDERGWFTNSLWQVPGPQSTTSV